MPASVKITLIGSLLLIATGVGFFFGTGGTHPTAMIPAGLGLVMLLCGLAAMKPAAMKIAMHVAVVVALLGAAGSTRVFMKWAEMTVAARSAQLITLVICLVLLAVFIGSFVQARRSRAPEAGPA